MIVGSTHRDDMSFIRWRIVTEGVHAEVSALESDARIRLFTTPLPFSVKVLGDPQLFLQSLGLH